VTLGLLKFTLNIENASFVTIARVMRSLVRATVIGWDFLCKHKAIINLQNSTLQIGNVTVKFMKHPIDIIPPHLSAFETTVVPPLYPKAFTVQRKDGKQGGYSDTLIGWKTDPFCFGFFPQNDSIKPLCYRSQDSIVKYYDIEKEAMRTDYNIKLTGAFSYAPNITASIVHVNESMWITQNIWGIDQCVCANPSGQHCTTPPCKSYVWHWDTFKDAQYLGRERIGAEWIQHHGTGTSSKMMELDHFIFWTHHIWTDPVSRHVVRAWKPFNGLQLYDPEAWELDITDKDVFHAPPEMCKKGGAPARIHCDDNGFWDGTSTEGEEILLARMADVARQAGAAATAESIVI